MADFGVAVRWGATRPGREKQALEVWGEALGVNDRAVAEGRLERWDAVLYELGPEPLGEIRLHGSRQQVDDFVASEDFRSVVMRAAFNIEGVGIRRFVQGDELIRSFGQFSALIDSQ